jgi:hypothetical protein
MNTSCTRRERGEVSLYFLRHDYSFYLLAGSAVFGALLLKVLGCRHNVVWCVDAGLSRGVNCTPACGVVWTSTQDMSGMTCGGMLFPTQIDTTEYSTVPGCR